MDPQGQDSVLAADTAHEAIAALCDASPGSRSSSSTRSIVGDVAGRLFADEPAAAPARLGRFADPTVISYGGMGVVHRAFDPVLGRPVAIKLCRPDRPHRDRDYERLLAEARTLATLDHPNVVHVHEAGRLPDGQLYIALEYVEGEDLARWLAKPRPWQDVVAAFVQAARGLEAVHRRGLVHRDIKPANLLRRPDGTVKLIDFGLVKELPGDDPPDATGSSDALHTETGRILGTRGFLAPELFLGAAPGVASDVFALCVGLYIGLYNRRPFVGPARAHTSRAPTRPRATASQPPVLSDILGPWYEPARGERGVPDRIVAVLRRGLAADPRARFPSAAAVIAALAPEPARKPTLWLVGAALFASLAGAAWARAAGPEPCSGVADEIADLWTPAQRDHVRLNFQRSGLDHAEATFAAVDRQLAEHRTAWTAVRGQTCHARLDRRDSAAAHAARTACLERSAQQLRAVVARLADTRAAVLHAPEQLAALGSPHACASPQIAAQACHAVPEDPRLRAAVARVDATIADARASQIAGDFTAAVTLAESAVRDADATDLRGLQATAGLALGDALRVAGHDRRAAAVLLRARDAAQEVQCVDIHADILGRLNKIAALSGGTPVAVVDERVAQQQSLARALGPAHDRIADAEHEHALVALHLHRDAQTAEASFNAAIATRLALPNLSTHQVLALADSHLGLASALARQSRSSAADEALRRSIAYRTVAVGDNHPSMYRPYLNWGHRQLERGEYTAAEAAYTRALALASDYGANSRERNRVLTAMAILAERRGDLESALTHARAAADALDDQTTNIDWDAAENLAQLLTEFADPAAAIPLLTSSLEHRDHAADGVSRGGTRTRLADALLAADRPADALEQASLALTDLHGAAAIDADLAFAHLARGEALLALADSDTGLHMPAHAAADAADSLAEAIRIWTLRADNPERLAWARWAHARVRCEAQHSREDARSAATAAREQLTAQAPEIDAWLRTTCP